MWRYLWWLPAAALAQASVGCGEDKTIKPELQPFFCVTFSPDGKLLAAGRGTYYGLHDGKERGSVFVWPTDTWEEPRILRNNLTSAPEGIAFTDDGREIIAASDAYRSVRGTIPPWDGKRIYTWEVESGKATEPIILRDDRESEYMKYVGFVSQMAYSPKAGLVGLALSGDRPVVIELKTGKPKYNPEGGGANSTCLAFSPDSKTLASCESQSKTRPALPVKLFAADTGKLLAESDLGMHGCQLAFSPDGSQLVVGGKGGDVVFVSSDLKKAGDKIQVSDKSIAATAYSPKGDFVAVGTAGWFGKPVPSKVYLVDPKEGKVTRTLVEDVASLSALAFSPDGKLLAAAYGTVYSADKEEPAGGVKVWEVATGKLLKDLKSEK